MRESHLLFRGDISNGDTMYVPIPISDTGEIGGQVGWKDATSSATITLELSSFPAEHSPAGQAWEWKDSGLSFTGPAASAAGSFLINIENVRQAAARLKIVAAAATHLEVRSKYPMGKAR